MGISLSTRVKIPEQVLKRELDGEAVILNLESEKYYGLDEIGTRMLVVLSESESIQKALEVLESEYDVDRTVLERDLLTLVDRLKEQGLLETIEA